MCGGYHLTYIIHVVKHVFFCFIFCETSNVSMCGKSIAHSLDLKLCTVHQVLWCTKSRCIFQSCFMSRNNKETFPDLVLFDGY